MILRRDIAAGVLRGLIDCEQSPEVRRMGLEALGVLCEAAGAKTHDDHGRRYEGTRADMLRPDVGADARPATDELYIGGPVLERIAVALEELTTAVKAANYRPPGPR